MKDASRHHRSQDLLRDRQGHQEDPAAGGAAVAAHPRHRLAWRVACYMAGIEGGVDGIDLSVRPDGLAAPCSPTCAPCGTRLKGTGYSLDIDVTKMDEIENLLNEGLKDYDFNPVTTTADARVVGFPMPGGAIGPNVHMMKEAGILDKYGEVLAEFPVVVEGRRRLDQRHPGQPAVLAAGLQQRAATAAGRRSTPATARRCSATSAAAAAARSRGGQDRRRAARAWSPSTAIRSRPRPTASARPRQALEERGLPVTDENIFLVAAAIVPGKNMELNEGIRLLTGKAEDRPAAQEEGGADGRGGRAAAPAPRGRRRSSPARSPPRCTVVEGGATRTFRITIEPPGRRRPPAPRRPRRCRGAGRAPPAAARPVFSPFEGKVELVEIKVKVGRHGHRGPGGRRGRGDEGQARRQGARAPARWPASTPSSATTSTAGQADPDHRGG